jgi:hypothetical protein
LKVCENRDKHLKQQASIRWCDSSANKTQLNLNDVTGCALSEAIEEQILQQNMKKKTSLSHTCSRRERISSVYDDLDQMFFVAAVIFLMIQKINKRKNVSTSPVLLAVFVKTQIF